MVAIGCGGVIGAESGKGNFAIPDADLGIGYETVKGILGDDGWGMVGWVDVGNYPASCSGGG